MTVKELLKEVCYYIGEDELAESSIFTSSNQQAPTTSQINKAELLLKCLNRLESELAEEFIPIKKERTLSSNGKIDFADIDSNFFEVLYISNKFGGKERFEIINGQISTAVGELTLLYSILPETKELTDNIESFNNKITPRVLGYGIAMEYCFMTSRVDDARVWESRYKNALISAVREKREHILPKRSW